MAFLLSQEQMEEAEAQHVHISATQLAPVLIFKVCNLDPRPALLPGTAHC